MREILKKAIVYRIMIMVSQMIFLYVVLGRIDVSIGITFSFGALATLEHILLEKVWEWKS